MQTVEGIVLQTKRVEEKEIVTLFSRELGIISIIYKPRAKNRANISELVKIEALFFPSHKDLLRATEVECISSYQNVRISLEAISMALNMLHEISRLLPPKAAHQSLYDVLDTHLKLISKDRDLKTIMTSFFLRVHALEGTLSQKEYEMGKELLECPLEALFTKIWI